MGEAKRRHRIPIKDLEVLHDFAFNLNTHNTPLLRCLNCGAPNDRASTHMDDPVEPGSIGICLYCRHFMVVDDNMQFRELNDEEIIELAGNPDILRLMGMLETFENWKKGKYDAEENPTTDSGDDTNK